MLDDNDCGGYGGGGGGNSSSSSNGGGHCPRQTHEVARQHNESLLLEVRTFLRAKTQQETQLSLTNRATRLEISQGHRTWYHSITYGF